MDTIGKRLSYLLKTHRIKLQDLADQLDVSKQTISLICSDKIQKPRKLDEIADILEVSYHWLAFGGDENNNKNHEGLILNKFHKIPLITSAADLNLKMFSEKELNIDRASHTFVLTEETEHTDLFAIKSVNNALGLRFGNSILIFKTTIEPVSGDFVICYLPDKELFVYRDLEIINHKKILVPLDKHIYNTLTVRKQDIIVAVLYEIRQKRNKKGGFLNNHLPGH